MLANISVMLLIALRIPKTLHEVHLNENKIAKQCRGILACLYLKQCNSENFWHEYGIFICSRIYYYWAAPTEAYAFKLHITQSIWVAADHTKCAPEWYCHKNSVIINTQI